MKKKSSVIILGVIIFIVCFILFALLFKKMVNDRKIINKRIDEIGKLYVSLNKYIDDYNRNRSSLNVLLEDTFVDNFDDKYKKVKIILDGEKKSLDSASEVISRLDSDCSGKKYSDANTNQICISYMINYEEMNNVFVSDVNYVNSIVDNYNSNHNEKLEKYSSDVDYIDYNKDGAYAGKEGEHEQEEKK